MPLPARQWLVLGGLALLVLGIAVGWFWHGQTPPAGRVALAPPTVNSHAPVATQPTRPTPPMGKWPGAEPPAGEEATGEGLGATTPGAMPPYPPETANGRYGAGLPATAAAPSPLTGPVPQVPAGPPLAALPSAALPSAAVPPAVPPPAVLPTLPPPSIAEPAWRRYAVATPPADGRPMIAIVIDDVGPNHKGAKRAITLPPAVTLAFLPYAHDVQALTAEARAAGHELLVHMPMEPDDLAHNNPGPHALLTGMPSDEVLRSLRWGLDRFGGYVGINNHMGSRFTSRADDMTLVLGELKRRGLLFLDSKTTAKSVGAGLARRMGVPETSRDVFLDNDSSPGRVADQLAVTEAWARKHGRAIAIGHPHAGTLEALEHWLPGLAARGFVLVPLTALVAPPSAAG